MRTCKPSPSPELSSTPPRSGLRTSTPIETALSLLDNPGPRGVPGGVASRNRSQRILATTAATIAADAPETPHSPGPIAPGGLHGPYLATANFREFSLCAVR